jgi:RHS repeat-associated protein
LQDLLYRAVALTNSSGNIVEAYDTDAYGNTLIFTGSGPDGLWFTNDDMQSSYGANDIIFCGYRFDPESQLYYVRNRSYSPVLGRWLQRDPIGYAGGINLYEYVEGRAEVEVDPEGLLRCVPCYVCQQTLDQEEAQAIQQIRQEAIGLGFPGDLSWNITASGTLVLISSNLWGGPIGVTVGRILLLGGIIGKLIELGALIQQLDAEIQSDIAAYKNCMKNCTN